MRFTTSLVYLYSVGASLAATLPATSGASANDAVNPFVGREFFRSPVYTEKVKAAASAIKARGDATFAKKALKVADVSTFLWVSELAAVPSITDNLKIASTVQFQTFKKQIVQFVVYNIPDRDCSAKASSGELSYADGGEKKYQTFIDQIAAQLRQFPYIDVVIQLETDAVGNIVSNQAVEKCANARDGQLRSLSYAVAKLQLPNVSIYLDGAHAGWLGWPDSLGPTADVLTQIISGAKKINPQSKVRGVATDVSNYNGLGNEVSGADELKYVRDLAPLLKDRGFDAHFIVDQGRSGNQTATRSGGDWCNNKYAGFGPRPSAKTPDALVDAIVWVKPGGEGDGTSDTSSSRFDEACVSQTSLVPAPEAGTWFQDYFELLVKQANPAF